TADMDGPGNPEMT
uniref:Chaperone, TCP1-related n=1 Tax=Avena sativa TaxID=4498 RepID=Q7M1G8_AVESA